jgi:hypothetical protein
MMISGQWDKEMGVITGPFIQSLGLTIYGRANIVGDFLGVGVRIEPRHQDGCEVFCLLESI